MFKLGICGTRNFSDEELFLNSLQGIIDHYGEFDTVITGGSPGADAMAEKWAIDHKMHCEIYTFAWSDYKRGMGYRRPKDIVKYSDVLLAFWDGVSLGTKVTVELAKEAGKFVVVIPISGSK